MHTRLSAG